MEAFNRIQMGPAAIEESIEENRPVFAEVGVFGHLGHVRFAEI